MHVVVSDEDADVAVLKAPHDVLHLLHRYRVDTGERLVKHDELWVDGQTARDLGTAALTTGELVSLVLSHLVEAELGKQALKLLVLLLTAEVRHLKDGEDVVLHAHGAEHARLLREVAHTVAGALVHGVVRDLLVVDVDVPLIRHHQSGGHIERRGLAGAVRPEQSDDFSLAHVD